MSPNHGVVLVIIVATRFKFDDERVSKEDVKRALEEQYGGEEEVNECIAFFSFCFSNYEFILVFSFMPCNSYPRQILASIMLRLNLQNTRMHTCSFTYVKATKRR